MLQIIHTKDKFLLWYNQEITLYVIVQGVSKKRYFLGFRFISVLEVRFYFFLSVFESFLKPNSLRLWC